MDKERDNIYVLIYICRFIETNIYVGQKDALTNMSALTGKGHTCKYQGVKLNKEIFNQPLTGPMCNNAVNVETLGTFNPFGERVIPPKNSVLICL